MGWPEAKFTRLTHCEPIASAKHLRKRVHVLRWLRKSYVHMKKGLMTLKARFVQNARFGPTGIAGPARCWNKTLSA